jgi:hypothetical protein
LAVSRQREHLASGGVGQVAVDKRLLLVGSFDLKDLSSAPVLKLWPSACEDPPAYPFLGM